MVDPCLVNTPHQIRNILSGNLTHNPAFGDGREEVDVLAKVLRRTSADVAHHLTNVTDGGI